MINATIDQMRRHGVAGASVSCILQRSSLARRTLYKHFPDGKPALVAAATETAAGAITSTLAMLHAQPDPVSLVESFIDLWAVNLEATDYRAGCPIVAATLGSDEAPAAAETAARAFADWIDLGTRLGEQAGLDHQAAVDLATMIVATVEGAVIISTAQRSSDPLRRCGRDLALLVETKIASAQPRPADHGGASSSP